MTRRVPVLIAVLIGSLTLLTSSASAARLPKPPVVKSVSPLKLGVGDVLTIRGRNFKRGKFANLVVFQRVRARAVFVRADSATATVIRLRVPAKLLPFLSQRAGKPVATRFRLRVLARRFGLAFTRTAMSPLIGPVGEGNTAAPLPATGEKDCDHDGILNTAEADDDNDLIPDADEPGLKLDPCNPDSDADTIEDGYEYYAALDLNSRALPYPGKRPYPNPLDGSDAGRDHDGDGMAQSEEYAAFIRYSTHTLDATGRLPAYSDGDQTTQGFLAIPPGKAYMNTDETCASCDGRLWISDDELDVDGDGIGNWDEIRGAFDTLHVKSLAYKPLLDYLDADTDGDTVPDGEDDQDHDDVSNVEEIQDPAVLGEGYRVEHRFDHVVSNALNPCDPNENSRSCPLHP